MILPASGPLPFFSPRRSEKNASILFTTWQRRFESQHADGCAEGATKYEAPSAMSIHKRLCINTTSIYGAEGATYFVAPSAD